MLECPSCGSDTYPVLRGHVTCTNPDCERYTIGWDPADISEPE